MGNLGEMIDDAARGDTTEVRRISGELEKLPSNIATDAFLVWAVGSGVADAPAVAGEKLAAGLQSAERKIEDFVMGAPIHAWTILTSSANRPILARPLVPVRPNVDEFGKRGKQSRLDGRQEHRRGRCAGYARRG